jgi:hypothetical protein
MDFAERLALWCNAFDAIRLQALHQAVRAGQPGVRGKGPVRVQALRDDVQRVRGTLAKAVTLDPVALAEARRDPLEELRLARRGKARPVDAEAAGSYAPWQQRHLELQGQMEMMVTPLREHVREAVGRASPRLRQLAALDAVFAQVIAPREQALLPTAATLLERRFEQLRGQDGGLDAFAAEWRQALLAELDLRLEPVVGLVDALARETDSFAP